METHSVTNPSTSRVPLWLLLTLSAHQCSAAAEQFSLAMNHLSGEVTQHKMLVRTEKNKHKRGLYTELLSLINLLGSVGLEMSLTVPGWSAACLILSFFGYRIAVKASTSACNNHTFVSASQRWGSLTNPGFWEIAWNIRKEINSKESFNSFVACLTKKINKYVFLLEPTMKCKHIL